MTEQEQITETLRASEANAWEKLLQTEAGRWVVHTILEECGVWRQSFTPQEADATAFNEGRRSIGLQLMRDRVMVDGSDVFSKMLAEHDARIERIRIAIKTDEEKEQSDG